MDTMKSHGSPQTWVPRNRNVCDHVKGGAVTRQQFIRRRLGVLAILRLGSMAALHKNVSVCPRVIVHQLMSGVLSLSMRDSLGIQGGADEFRFVMGEDDTLRDSAASEVQPCR